MPNKTALDAAAPTISAGTPGTTSFAVTSTTLGAGQLKGLITMAEASGGHAELVSGVLTLFYAPA